MNGEARAGHWTTERQPGDDAVCTRYGCEDRTHPVHHWIEDEAASPVPLDVDLPPWHHEKPWSPLELDDIRRNWTEHPERFSVAAGRWLATLDLVDPGADR